MKVAYVYANPRSAVARDIAAGIAADTPLLGQNHLHEHGIEASIYEPLLQRRVPRQARVARAAWHLRELILPFELRDIEVVCTSLGPLVPLAARLRPRLRTLVFNMGLCNRFERSSPAARRLLAAGVRAADAVVCFADSQRDRLLAQTGADPARVHSVPLGVDERFLRMTCPPPSDGHVLAVGRDLARDYGTLAAAVAGLDARIVLVTSPRNLQGIELPAGVDVRFDVSPVELRSLYDGARCVVIPTRAESFPYGADCTGQTVLLDALAMGRPVVVSERSTLRGYVEPDRTALVVPPEEPQALRDALERILRDETLRAMLGSAGRNLVEHHLTTRLLAARLARIVASLGGATRETRDG